ncbi:hypothetical protein HDE_07726 [Halotydeus destructor]|nr:hypothetical protein HDE_07726 [Halotydeus destructor]
MFINHTAIHFYHIVLNVLSNVNEDFLRSCAQDGAVPVDSHQLRLTKINHLKGLFDQNMSYYPSVWFMRLFIECLTFSSSLVRRSMTWDVLVTLHAFSALTDILTVACIILHVDYADRCATELYNQLTQKLDGSESPEVRALVKEIGTTYKLNVSVCLVVFRDNMASLYFFRAMDLWLSVYGMKLFDLSRWQRVAGVMAAIFTVSCTINCIIESLMHMLDKIDYTSIQFLIFDLQNLSIIVNLLSSKQNLRHMINQISGFMTTQARYMVRRKTIFLAILLIFKLVFELVLFGVAIDDVINMSPLRAATWALGMTLFEMIYRGYINVTACFLYHSTLVALRAVNEEYIGQSVPSAMSVVALQLRFTQIDNLKRLFDRNMSYYPSVWFLGLFIDCLTLATTLTHRQVAWDIFTKLHVYSIVKHSILVASVILHVDHADHRCAKLYSNLAGKLDGSESPEMRALVKEIGKGYKLDLSVWSMFPIERGAILTFASAVVSFTVLFTQIAPAI